MPPQTSPISCNTWGESSIDSTGRVLRPRRINQSPLITKANRAFPSLIQTAAADLEFKARRKASWTCSVVEGRCSPKPTPRILWSHTIWASTFQRRSNKRYRRSCTGWKRSSKKGKYRGNLLLILPRKYKISRYKLQRPDNKTNNQFVIGLFLKPL